MRYVNLAPRLEAFYIPTALKLGAISIIDTSMGAGIEIESTYWLPAIDGIAFRITMPS